MLEPLCHNQDRKKRRGESRFLGQNSESVLSTCLVGVITPSGSCVAAVADELPPLLKELRSFNYLNDERFAGNFVRYRAGKAWGRLRFRQELLQRGVSAEVVENVLREAPELQADQLDSKLRRTAEKELRRGKEEKKIIASLLRKGFSVGQVRKALEQIVSEDTLDRLE